MNTTAEPPVAPLRASRRAEQSRALLRTAERHLDAARAALDADPPRYPAALEQTLAVAPAALRAFLTWRGSAEMSEDEDLRDLTVRAVDLSSILDTPARRALVLADRAPAIARAERLTVYDREDVSAGWYAARNLYRTVCDELPEAFRDAGAAEAVPRENRGG